MGKTDNRADGNRAARLEAIRRMEELLKEAIAASFTGSIEVRVDVKDGRLGAVRDKRERYYRPD